MEIISKKEPVQPYTIKMTTLSYEAQKKFPYPKFIAFLNIPGSSPQNATDIEVYLDNKLNLSLVKMIATRYPIVYDTVCQHVYYKGKLKELIKAIRLLYDVRLR